MSYLLESVLPPDFFTTMVSVMAYQKMFAELIEIYPHFRSLSAKMEELQLDSSVFSMQWFVCLYVCTLDENVKT